MKKTLLLFFIVLTSVISVKAQLTESFDGATFPPTGWTTTLISAGDGSAQGGPGLVWDRVTTSTFPTATPHSGAGMARYDAYDFDPSSKADLITPAMNFSGNSKRVTFWMYRSATYIDPDSLTVYVNTAASATGATFLGKISRYIGNAPVVAAVGWYQYYFDIPTSFNGTSNYIIFRGNGEYGLSMLIDDVTVEAQPSCLPPDNVVLSNYNYAAGTATLTWTVSNSNPGGYEWAVNTDGTLPASGTAVTGTTASITGITAGAINNVFIRSNCGGGDFSNWYSIPMAALPCAPLTSPANGAINVAQSPTFTWTAVTGANGYRFYLGLTPNSLSNLGITTNTTATINNFIPLVTYYWYVVPAIDGIEAPGGTCVADSFTVKAEAGTPPNNPCSGAITITSGNTAANPVNGTTVGATISKSKSASCNGFDPGTPDDDVWFEFTTSATTTAGTLTITPTATGGIKDIVAQIYAGTSCANLGPLVSCTDEAVDANPEVVDLTALSPNTHYFIRVYSWSNLPADEGAFTIVASAGNTLPVALTTFTARRVNGVNILNWSTQQELNSKYFTIERSNDGRNFASIGQVTASGNSNTVHNYTFTDAHPVKGNNYYRLRTTDKDNLSKLSIVRSIRNEGVADIALYPNPAKDKLSLTIDADRATKGKLQITDMSGKIVYSNSIQLPQGNTVLPVSLSNIASGAYILKIQLNDDVIVKKFNKQ